jgi:hypothetical protein
METIFNRITLLEQQHREAENRCDNAIRKCSAIQTHLIATLKERIAQRNRFVLIAFTLLSVTAWIITSKYAHGIWVGLSLVGALVMYFLGVVLVAILQFVEILPKSRLQKLYSEADEDPEIAPLEKIVRLEEAECHRIAKELVSLYPQRKEIQDKAESYIRSLNIPDSEVRSYLYHKLSLKEKWWSNYNSNSRLHCKNCE